MKRGSTSPVIQQVLMGRWWAFVSFIVSYPEEGCEIALCVKMCDSQKNYFFLF